MLLLKYPSPNAPNGPQTFVDDAIFLRDNFSAAGGAKIIAKYSGKLPTLSSSASRPSTPLGQALSPKRALSRTRSPLPSPARFLQQQGGVEALFQGAAKGVFDRGERLGINQAVRDAVGEVKKNMQGLQVSRSQSGNRKTSDVMRWSLDEGKSIPSSRASVAAMNARNQQLARMLGQAMTDLRAVSVSTEGDKEEYVAAMDLAIAKVEFVKVYLEDATMPLPEEPSHAAPKSPSPLTSINTPQPPLSDSLHPAKSVTPASSTTNPGAQNILANPKDNSLQSSPIQDTLSIKEDATITTPSTTEPSIDLQEAKTEPAGEVELPARPKAPVPTRSSIAQSSFSWMLEPDTTSGSSHKSSPPKSPSPFLKSGRRPNSGPNREKAAFLFGEDGAESNMNSTRQPVLVNAEEAFNLGTLRGSKAK
jgi:TBC1 domain family protein 5